MKPDPNLSPFIRKPSDFSEYNRNTIFKGYNMRNSFNNLENIESPFYPTFRYNSNSVFDFNNNINNSNTYFTNNIINNYNSFKHLNSNNDFFNFERPNFISKDSGVVNAFRRTESNELNKLNRINYLFNPFVYKRSTSFGSIKDGKFDNYNNDDINKQ